MKNADKSPRKIWREEDDRKLRELVDDGLSSWQIAEEMGVSKHQVDDRSKALKLPRIENLIDVYRKFEVEEDGKKKYKEGRLGYRNRVNEYVESEMEPKVVDLLKRGISIPEISKRLKFGGGFIRKIKRKHNIKLEKIIICYDQLLFKMD